MSKPFLNEVTWYLELLKQIELLGKKSPPSLAVMWSQGRFVFSSSPKKRAAPTPVSSSSSLSRSKHFFVYSMLRKVKVKGLEFIDVM